jgi:subtilisin family serine protease
MNRILTSAVLVLLILWGSSPLWAQQDREYVPGEILVKYKRHVKESRIAALHSKWGLRTKKAFRRFGMRQVKLPEGMSVEDARDILKNDPDIEYVEPNYRRHPQETIPPNDTDFDLLWGLHNTGQWVNGSRGIFDADIDALEAWKLFQDSSDTIVAVLDTGVDYTHPDLNANIWKNEKELHGIDGYDDDGNGYTDDVYGWDFYSNDKNPMDEGDHGTHVAGIIAAEMDNTTGIAGVAPNARIMVLRFMNGDGSVSDEIDAINYAIEKEVKIINMSFGSYNSSTPEREAMRDAGEAGILFIAAAGNRNTNNDGSSSLYPASYNLSNIISVAATDQDDRLWEDSNYGAISVDVGAPGVNIYSTTPDNHYSYKNGTSMATPHVAGLAALLRGKNMDLRNLEIKSIILETVDSLYSLDGITTAGGRINALNTLTYELPNPPAAPGDLVVATGSSSSITLTWSDDSDDETGFIIERREAGDVIYEEIGAVPSDTETYRDTRLYEGTSYSYRIFAYNAGGRSDYSNEAEATTNIAAPANLVLEEASRSQLTLSWRDRSSKEEGFTIERKAEGEVSFSEIATLPSNTETYDDQGLKFSTVYEYRVRAYKGDSYSAYSNEESATTLAGGGGGSGGGGPCFIGSLLSR